MPELLWISDASPLFFYSPTPAYFAGSNRTAPWTGSIDPSAPIGNNTFHSTTGPAGVILPAIHSRSFTPLWNGPGNWSTGLGIGNNEPSPWTSGKNYSDFTDFNFQTFTIHAQCDAASCAAGTLDFRGGWLGTEFGPPGAVLDSVLIDDASPVIAYSGFAPISSSATPINGPSIATTPQDYGGTLSTTSTPDASASVTFSGASILIKGVTTPQTGQFTVTLDGAIYAMLDSSNEVAVHDIILFFASNLDTSVQHTLTLTCIKADGNIPVGLVIDSFEIHGPQGNTYFVGDVNGAQTTIAPGSQGAGTPTATQGPFPTDTADVHPSDTPAIGNATNGGAPNAGVIIGALLGSLAGLALLAWFFRRVYPKLKPGEAKLAPWDEANLLQNMKNEEVHVTTAAKQRYVYPGLIAHSELKKY